MIQNNGTQIIFQSSMTWGATSLKKVILRRVGLSLIKIINSAISLVK